MEPDICHRGCAYTYTVLHSVQRPGVHSAAYGTVHYKEPLKSFEWGTVPSSGFLLARYCHDCAESDEKQYLLVPFNPLTAKLFNLNFHPLEVVSR